MIQSFLSITVSDFVGRGTYVLLDGECIGHRLRLRGRQRTSDTAIRLQKDHGGDFLGGLEYELAKQLT